MEDVSELEALRAMIELHVRRTRSSYAKHILNNWEQFAGQFWRIQPAGTEMTARDFIYANEYDGLAERVSLRECIHSLWNL